MVASRWAGLAAALAVASSGCCGTPTPLAPGLDGSVGLPHHGVLTGAEELPVRGPGYRTLRLGAERWADPMLVVALQRASAEVERRYPGAAPLVVGDLSARRGGRIPRHRSHRTGRDVDLLPYVVTPDGRSVTSPGFVRFGPDGLAEVRSPTRSFVRLDVPRLWLLVRALLESPEVEVQWVFFARPLEALLIEYARARGEEPELIWRAETVLRQPSDSAAHDDHIHLRIACRPAQAVAGCAGGPRWPWQEPLPTTCPLDDDELLAALLDDAPATDPLPTGR